MESGIPLFKVRGIQIRMHITFPLILVWGAVQFGLLAGLGARGAVFGVLVTLLLFVIVVLHELGHSFVAQSYGITVRQIVLLPIGGVALLERIPEKPSQEFAIAIAGPLVNFGLAAVMAVLALVLGVDLQLRGFGTVLQQLGEGSLQAIFSYIFVLNLFLGLFNLLPAFPMDGGRVLRALLASRMDYARATALAVAIGQGLAWLMGLWGFLGGGFFLILVAIFIYTGAGQEGRMVQLRSVLRDLTVGQAYSRQVKALTPRSTLREAIDITLNSFQSDFPICEGEQLVGLLTHTQVVKALHRTGPDSLVTDFMHKDLIPVSPDQSLYQAQKRLMGEGLDALPVVDAGRFVGLVTSRDVNEVYSLASQWPELGRPSVQPAES
ncbi:MAG: site-2 protease family protein [Chloroflexi bacterium]|nr:site-2 protease family protein [Chloroflexota bacterium]